MKFASLDNGLTPATSLTKVKNLRGNIPQFTTAFSGSSIQDSTYWTVSNISNWSSISSIKRFDFNAGDGVTPCMHTNFTQDFMANNKGLTEIFTAVLQVYRNYVIDTNFKVSLLKSNWNTYFTELSWLAISDDNWNREDLSALRKLNFVSVSARTTNHTNDPTGNPVIPLPSSVIDNIIMQVSAGAGQSVINGQIYIDAGGTSRTSASDAAVAQLVSKGWIVSVNYTNQ